MIKATECVSCNYNNNNNRNEINLKENINSNIYLFQCKLLSKWHSSNFGKTIPIETSFGFNEAQAKKNYQLLLLHIFHQLCYCIFIYPSLLFLHCLCQRVHVLAVTNLANNHKYTHTHILELFLFGYGSHRVVHIINWDHWIYIFLVKCKCCLDYDKLKWHCPYVCPRSSSWCFIVVQSSYYHYHTRRSYRIFWLIFHRKLKIPME